jgi:hypothetical protein
MRVRIVSNGTSLDETHVFDAETDEELDDVTHLHFFANAMSGEVVALMTRRVEIELEADFQLPTPKES